MAAELVAVIQLITEREENVMNDKKKAPVEDETKRKFREALEAKQGRKGEDHIDSGSTNAHAHGPVDAKRTFRRKTGG